ncbi:MAG: RNA polymerase sigma factor [Ignavibacteria bacterium]
MKQVEINTALIIKELKSGEFKKFNHLVEKLKNSGLALAYRIIKNHQDAEDILQESFIKLYSSLINSEFKAFASIKTYFYRLVYNTAIDYYRKVFRKRLNIFSIDVNSSHYEDGSELHFEIMADTFDFGKFNLDELVAKYLDYLPPQYSIILTLYYINELNYEEISEILGIPMGTVKNRLFRAREKFKRLLLKHFTEKELIENIS